MIVEEIREEEIPESSWEQEYLRGIVLGIAAVIIIAAIAVIATAIWRACHE